MTDPAFKDFVEEVKRRNPLEDIVGADTQLKPAGSVLKGRSPFVEDKTPSFCIWTGSQTWHDYAGGGGKGGDVIDYVMAREKIDFWPAVCWLADRAGMKRPDEDPETHAKNVAEATTRLRLETILTLAANHYHRVLPSKIRAEWYRDHYGFTDDTIDELRLGWADGHLYDALRDEGVTKEEALSTGLFVQFQNGEIIEFFNDRLVFPYWHSGRAYYFTARQAPPYTAETEHESAKYKKLLTHSDKHPYVSTLITNDRFYNEDDVKGAEDVFITEGTPDCISGRQIGLKIFSPNTTSLRKKDVPRLIEVTRRAKRVFIANDVEDPKKNKVLSAGDAGAVIVARELYAAGRDVRIITLPRPAGETKIDLNEFIRARPHDQAIADFEKVRTGARRFIDFLIDSIPVETPKPEITSALEPIIDVIAKAPPFERDSYIETISKRFGLRRPTVRKMVDEKAPPPISDEKKREQAERREKVRGEILEEIDHYYVYGNDGQVEIISSFAIRPTQRIVTDQGELFLCDITAERGVSIKGFLFPRSAFQSKKDFLRAISAQPDLQWTGNDDNVQGLLRILSACPVPRRQGTMNLGYVDTETGPRWVSKTSVISSVGVSNDDAAITYIPSGNSLAERVKYEDTPLDDAKRIAAEVLPSLLELNEPATILPVIGWFFATPFRPRLIKLVGSFPILTVAGTMGSGKTSLIRDIFWRLFGVVCKPGEGPYSATETEFAMIRLLSSTNSVPVFIDEYKPGDMPKHRIEGLHRMLRRIYGGETEERGRRDLTTQSFNLSSPVVMAGEARPEGDPALIERMISVAPNKNQITAARKAAFGRLRRQALHRLAVPFIKFALGRDTEADLERARAVTDRIFAAVPEDKVKTIPTRCLDNLVAMVLGLTMYEAFAVELGVKLPELDIIPAATAAISDLIDGDRAVKDSFDLFLEALSTYALAGSLQEGKHYAMVNGEICLHLPSCYEIYLTERRKTGREDATNGMRALKKIAAENNERKGYVIEMEKRVSMSGNMVRCLVIDPQRIPQALDVEEFPISNRRTHGGKHDVVGGWDGDELQKKLNYTSQSTT